LIGRASFSKKINQHKEWPLQSLYRTSIIWSQAFDETSMNEHETNVARSLAASFETFRSHAELLAAKIAVDVPQLTDHSVRHLDRLWHVASTIVGNDQPLNAVEAYILGGAFLLHDLGNSVAAQKAGIESLKGPHWDDLIVSLFLSTQHRRPSAAELECPPAEIERQAIFHRLREVHAKAAEALACEGFVRHDNPDERIYLIDTQWMRDEFGHLIGAVVNRLPDENDRTAMAG
jgi:hypothetical protein